MNLNLDNPRVLALLIPTTMRLASAPDTSTIEDVAAHIARVMYGNGAEVLPTDHACMPDVVKRSIAHITMLATEIERIGSTGIRYKLRGFKNVEGGNDVQTVECRVLLVAEEAKVTGKWIDYSKPEASGLVDSFGFMTVPKVVKQ